MKSDREPGLPRLYQVAEVAEILDVSPRTVRRMIARGELTACCFGRIVRVHPDDLARDIDRHRRRKAAPGHS